MLLCERRRGRQDGVRAQQAQLQRGRGRRVCAARARPPS